MILPQVTILGLGNILLQDEGLGIHLLEQLQKRYFFPPTVQLIDGGVMGLELLAYIETATDVLVIDAVQMGQSPGTLIRLEQEAISKAFALKLSIHQLGFQETLAICRLRNKMPARMVLWGMEPEVIALGVNLSPRIAQQLEHLINATVAELAAWGIVIRKQSEIAVDNTYSP